MHPFIVHIGVLPRLKSRKSFINALSPSTRRRKPLGWNYGENDASPWTPVYTITSVLTNTSQLVTTWKTLNRLRTQVGRSRVNMLKSGFPNEQDTCDCGIRKTMQHLLACPMMDTACSPQDLTTANDIAIGCARHWEGTI